METREYKIRLIREQIRRLEEMSDTIIDILFGLLCR